MFHSASVVSSTSILVFGGRAAPSQPLSHVYLLDTTTMAWRKPALVPESSGSLPQARYRHTATTCMVKGREAVVVFGGRVVAGKNDFRAVDDVWCIDPISLTARPLQTTGPTPPPRFSHAAVAVENGTKLFVYGGTEGRVRFQDSWLLDFESGTWECVKSEGAVPPARFAHCLSQFIHNGQEYALLSGGCTPLALNDFHLFHVPSRQWTRIRFSCSFAFAA